MSCWICGAPHVGPSLRAIHALRPAPSGLPDLLAFGSAGRVPRPPVALRCARLPGFPGRAAKRRAVLLLALRFSLFDITS